MVALGDLDNDGDLDAFIASGLPTRSNKVWLNNGIGNFSDSGQTLGTSNSIGLALGDVDGDGDLDAFVANHGAANVGHGNKVWLNDGNGNFSDNGQSLGSSFSAAVALGDLDGDGDLDAFVANGFGGNHPGKVWLNDGNGNFNDSGQNLGSSNSFEVALGDLDEDGDLDAFVANGNGQGNKIWLNDGNGNFNDSGQNLGSSNSFEVALGDLDEDGDLDAFVANGDNQSNKVWLNDGNGNFNNSGQALGNSSSWGLALGDLDGDSDLDAFVGNFLQGDKVWLNENQPNPSGSITLIKQANQDATFYFSGDLGDFSLPTAGSKQFTNLSSGSYTITEATTQDWVLISVQCTAAGANTFDYGFDFSAQSVTIQLMPNQDVTCTLINEKPNFEPASCRLYLPLIFNTDKRVPKSE